MQYEFFNVIEECFLVIFFHTFLWELLCDFFFFFIFPSFLKMCTVFTVYTDPYRPFHDFPFWSSIRREDEVGYLTISVSLILQLFFGHWITVKCSFDGSLYERWELVRPLEAMVLFCCLLICIAVLLGGFPSINGIQWMFEWRWEV